jgi:hypothetical protein
VPLFVPQLCRLHRLYRFAVPRKALILQEESGGHARNRTGVRGFAVRCVTTLPRGLGIEAAEVLGRDRQPAARARRWGVDRAHHSGLGLWRAWNDGLATYGASTASWWLEIRGDTCGGSLLTAPFMRFSLIRAGGLNRLLRAPAMNLSRARMLTLSLTVFILKVSIDRRLKLAHYRRGLLRVSGRSLDDGRRAHMGDFASRYPTTAFFKPIFQRGSRRS